MTARTVAARRRWSVIGLVVCLAFVGMAALSDSASAEKTPSTINLCIAMAGPDKDTVRFVPGKHCKHGELLMRIAGGSGNQGALGIEGSGGEAGPQGPAGPRGPIGPRGEKGEKGDKGDTGPAGATQYLRTDSSTSATSATSPKTVTVTCTGGRSVLSGGWDIAGGGGEVNVTVNEATSNSAWTVTAVEDDDSDAGSWAIQAHAVCALVTP